AIEATLKLYSDPDRLAERLPTLRMLARTRAEIEAQARRILPDLQSAVGTGFDVELRECRSQIGSGALPLDTIESAGLAVRSKSGGAALERLASAFRALSRPVIGRLDDGALILDLRCLTDEAAFLSVLSTLNLDASA
ncbi:MAG: L-seryl-tRNA(Sec) selenium transferase, partial [Hyphomicrobium sp.]